MTKRALISVYYKEGILELAQFLVKNSWEIISTGGTGRYLQENNITFTDVSELTKFPECLDGRVKTLHPLVHAGILGIRANAAHVQTMQELGVQPIDLVCVNLYPFFEKVQAGLEFEETVEFIDIGGPTMLRAAAKNYQDVLVLSEPADYAAAIAALTAANQDLANIPADFKRKLAGKVFNLTSAYDAAVSRFMLAAPEADAHWPNYNTVPYTLSQSLRYGENAHQRAALYLTADAKGALAGMEQIQGKELSYNNIRDLDIAWKAASSFSNYLTALPPAMPQEALADGRKVICVALKHNTPCGAALGNNLLEAYTKTHLCDPVSIFGGIVGCNVEVDANAAQEMVKTFLEVIVAPSFSPAAREIFATKKNLRLIQANLPAQEEYEYLSVDGGLLVQSRDRNLFTDWKVVTQRAPSAEDAADMAFGMTMAMFVKSNAIVAICNRTLVGAAGGQVNRIWATEQALSRAEAVTSKPENGFSDRARVMVSDAFFPFADSVEMAGRFGIRAICQPGGSMRDQESIDLANELGISMVFTGTRHFKH